MKRLFTLFFFILPITSFTFEQIDYACLNNCTNNGYQYNYCQSACSFDENQNIYESKTPKVKQTDYKCVADCTSKGYMYNFCTDRCSF